MDDITGISIEDMNKGSRESRSGFLKLLAGASAGVALGATASPLIASAATDDPITIISVALVAEYLAVTFQTNALANAATIGLRPDEIATVRAVVSEEAIHINYLKAYGAKDLYGAAGSGQAFTFPANTFTSRSGYATTAVILETAFVTAYMAAVRDFAANSRADLAQLAYQVGAVEAEHRALSRVIGGFVPYSDLAFETSLVSNVAGAATVLTNLGFLGNTAANPVALQFTTAAQTQALSYAHILTQQTPGGSRRPY